MLETMPKTRTVSALQLLGEITIPKLVGDPTAEPGQWPEGYIAYWLDGDDLILGVYDTEEGWFISVFTAA